MRQMKDVLKNKLDTFAENRSTISKEFVFQNDELSTAAALVFTNAGKSPDIEKIKECRKILQGKTGLLSGFQGMVELILISKMSLQANPENYIDDVLEVYNQLKSNKIVDYYEEIMASMTLVESGRFTERESVIAKYKEIIKRMKKEHPILTDHEDFSFVMLLALIEKDVDTIIVEIEECFDYMRKNFPAGQNAIQGISEVFTLYDTDVKTKCDKAIEIYNLLKERGVKYGRNHEFASLAILTNIDADTNVLIDEIAEASEYLKQKKGFGDWAIGSSERLMFAAMATAGTYDTTINDLGNAATNTIAVIVAEEIEMMMMTTIMTTNMVVF